MPNRVWFRAVNPSVLSIPFHAGFWSVVALLIVLQRDGLSSAERPPVPIWGGYEVYGDANVSMEIIEPVVLVSTPIDAAPQSAVIDVERYQAFIWPASGPITSRMGPDHPAGIDIGLGVEAPIVAAARGTVTMTGATEDYGYYLVLDHGNGMSTLYAHLSRIVVTRGQQVDQSALIGQGGSTGRSDGKHLHLEIHDNGALLDPLRVLPAHKRTYEHSQAECGPMPLVIDRGSRTVLKLDGVIGESASELTASIESISTNAPPIQARVIGRTALEIASAPSFRGPRDDTYQLKISFFDGQRRRTLDCDVLLKTWRLLPSFYARAATATPAETPSLADEATLQLAATPANSPKPLQPSVTPTSTAASDSSSPSNASAGPISSGTSTVTPLSTAPPTPLSTAPAAGSSPVSAPAKP